MNVLVAEDDPISQKVASGFLASLGHECEVVGNGQLAVEAVASGEFDAVLLDIHMPIMDGFEAARLICKEGESPAGGPPRIIVATADILDSTREQMNAIGVAAQITKPIHLETLATALEENTPAPRGSASVAANSGSEDAPEIDENQFFAALDPSVPESQEIFVAFRDSILVDIADLKKLLGDRDQEPAEHLAHRARGTLAILGFQGAAEAVRKLEVAVDGGEFVEAEEHLQTLNDLVQRGLTWSGAKLGA